MNISDTVKKAIQENLPQLVGAELQQYLEEAERTKKELAEAQKLNVRLKEVKDADMIALTSLNAKVAELESLGIRKEALDEQERNIRIVLAESSVAHARELAKQAHELVNAAFRNPVITKSIFDSDSKYIPGHQGNNWQGYNESSTKNYTATEKTE